MVLDDGSTTNMQTYIVHLIEKNNRLYHDVTKCDRIMKEGPTGVNLSYSTETPWAKVGLVDTATRFKMSLPCD